MIFARYILIGTICAGALVQIGRGSGEGILSRVSEEAALRQLIAKYAMSIDDADTVLASQIWSHSGTVQISSSPAGATVIRNGIEIGRTPITRSNIQCGDGILKVYLDSYAPAVVPINIREGLLSAYAVKLVSKRYLTAMEGARQALASQELLLATQYIKSALEADPTNADAAALLAKINLSAEQMKQQQLEAKRIADEEETRLKLERFRQEFYSIANNNRFNYKDEYFVFEPVAQQFHETYASVWSAVMEQAKAGIFRESPYLLDTDNGWLYSKWTDYNSIKQLLTLFLAYSQCRRYVVMVSDSGNGVYVQVMTELSTTRPIGDPTHPTGFQFVLDVNRDRSTKMSRSFLRAIQRRLNP
jgi:hypothetical protein